MHGEAESRNERNEKFYNKEACAVENRTAFPVQAAFYQAFSSTVHCICIVQVFIQLVHAVFLYCLSNGYISPEWS